METGVCTSTPSAVMHTSLDGPGTFPVLQFEATVHDAFEPFPTQLSVQGGVDVGREKICGEEPAARAGPPARAITAAVVTKPMADLFMIIAVSRRIGEERLM
jgi:hypothetical protein